MNKSSFNPARGFLNSEKDASSGNIKYVDLNHLELNQNNVYPITEIEEMKASLIQFGLLQPLLVQRINGDNTVKKYVINTGHRRYIAMSELLKEGNLDFERVPVIILDPDNEIISGLMLHETNMQTRSLLKLDEDTKLAIVEDYMGLLEQAKQQGIEFNGKPIKGKTRDLVAERFKIASSTAGEIIKKINEKKEGAEIGTQQKTFINKGIAFKKLEKQIDKGINSIDNSQPLEEEERELVESLINKLQELL